MVVARLLLFEILIDLASLSRKLHNSSAGLLGKVGPNHGDKRGGHAGLPQQELLWLD